MIKIRVATHSGEDDIVEVESFDANEMSLKRNDNTIESIAIGNGSYSRIDLKTVKPVDIEEIVE